MPGAKPTMWGHRAQDKLVLALICLALQPAIACNSSKTTAPVSGKIVVVFVDRSASTREDRDVYARALERIGDSLDLDDRIVVGAITATSSKDFVSSMDMGFPHSPPVQTLLDNKLQYENSVRNRKKEVEQTRQKFQNECRQILSSPFNSADTAIFQTLQIAEQIFAPEKRRRILVLLSDMLEDSGRLNFETARIDESFIRREILRQREARVLPRLPSVSVYIAGAQAGNMERAAAVQRFWLEYFKASGARIDDGHYSRVLSDFEK